MQLDIKNLAGFMGRLLPVSWPQECSHVQGWQTVSLRGLQRGFTSKTGTLFGESILPLRKWFICNAAVLFDVSRVGNDKDGDEFRCLNGLPSDVEMTPFLGNFF